MHRERYLDTYWSQWAILGCTATLRRWTRTDSGIPGCSDDTIKVAGSVGPAEVEAILNAHPAVQESAAIGVPHPLKDQEVVAFCVLRPGHAAAEQLCTELMERVVRELGKPLKPRAILL